MKLLAIDTSGSTCSAALDLDGQITQRLERAPRRHGELLLAMMDGLLEEASVSLHALDALAFGRGPGSFTGLRIAAAVTQGVAFGARLPVARVSTLAALAQGCHRRHGACRVLSALDARIGEVYWGCFELDEVGLMRPVCAERVCPPERVSFPAGDDDWWGAGPGWAAYANVLGQQARLPARRIDAALESEAQDIARLGVRMVEQGEMVTASQALPVYLRDRVAQPKTGSRKAD